MTFGARYLLAAAAFCVACERQPVAPDTASPKLLTASAASTPQYAAIDLGAWGASAINKHDMIVGTRGWDAVMYEDGAVRALPRPLGWTGEIAAQVVNKHGQIAGTKFEHSVLFWDSPDAEPKTFDTPFGWYRTTVIRITDDGDIVASLDDQEYHFHAFFQHDGVLQDIGGLQASGASNTYAHAANNRGQVVGESRLRFVPGTIDGEEWHAFIWENGVMRDLGTLGTHSCGYPPTQCGGGRARDINDHGTVVGEDFSGPIDRAFVWENGVMRDLGAYPGKPTSGIAINDRGQILAQGNGNYFIWDQGVVQVITSPSPYRVFPRALGEDGEVVGVFRDAAGLDHAFVWQDGVLIDLGPGGATGINERGDIIGSQPDPNDRFENRAVVWRKTGGAAVTP